MISAILLAAGESRRMGRFKQLLPFAGKTFVECCVDNLLASHVGEIIVVTGHRADDVRDALGNRPVRFAHNPDYLSGMSSSVKCGMQALSPDVRAVLVALVDQPQIGPEIINQIIAAYESNRPLIVVPDYEGRKGHPVLFDAGLKGEILAMDPVQGLRQVVHAHTDQTLRIAIASDAVLTDFDYPEDYARLGRE
ncbi:MAG TPA: nucleotidyltransferase family protein [Blastocatellia bacterium]|nr:nucleotidyltransferase family protein [Blastocatellia bacterium]